MNRISVQTLTIYDLLTVTNALRKSAVVWCVDSVVSSHFSLLSKTFYDALRRLVVMIVGIYMLSLLWLGFKSQRE